MVSLMILFSIALISVLLYYYITQNNNYWKIRGVIGPEPRFFFGNVKEAMLGQMAIGILMKQYYDKYKDEPVVGIFTGRSPMLMLRDPNLIKDIFIKDFAIFPDRGVHCNPEIDPLTEHLFYLEEAQWRPLRRKLTPAFTSGKLKQMFYLLVESAKTLEKYLNRFTEENEVINCRSITGKFTMEVIGSCAFGLNTGAITDESSQFFKMGSRAFETSFMKTIQAAVRELSPWLYDILGKYINDKELNDFFINSMKDTINHRKESDFIRHDFVDLLLDMQRNSEDTRDIDTSDHFLAAQAFSFFAAGFETSATTMTNALYELALNHDIQEKLREEIREEIRKNNGELTYEIVKNMTYLHMVFLETLRKYPPAGLILRMANQPYTLNGTNVTIHKGDKVMIPVYGLHHDPKIYPSPDTFDPERFTEKAVAARHPMFFIPFGEGPRICIGLRFASYQTKVGLITILLNYKVDVCEKTKVPYEFGTNSFVQTSSDGIYVKFVKLNV